MTESELLVLRSLSEHLDAVLSLATAPTPVTTMAPSDALGLTLAANIYAKLAVPPFHNSAMDGFLVHHADFNGPGPWTFPVIGDIPAGTHVRTPRRGAALRIMTGAPVPEEPGLAVVPVEHTNIPRGPQSLPSSVTIFTAPKPSAHIRMRGEDTAIGELTVAQGTRIDAATIAALVSTGNATVPVHQPIRVSILATGDELDRQIPNSNSPMLAALCQSQGAQTHVLPATGDTPAALRAALEAAKGSNLILTTGGISAGAFDIVRELLSPDVWFGQVALQPGKPQGAGTFDGIPILCLPGNPVSAFVSFHLFVAPLMRALSGQVPQGLDERPQLMASAACEFHADSKRDRFIPVRIKYGTTPQAISSHRSGLGSHFVASLAGVTGLAYLPHGTGTTAIGQPVRVLLV